MKFIWLVGLVGSGLIGGSLPTLVAHGGPRAAIVLVLATVLYCAATVKFLREIDAGVKRDGAGR